MREALVGPDIVLERRVVPDHAVLVDDGVIEAVVPIGKLTPDIPRHRLDGRYLSAGLVDIHVHGAAGRAFNEGDPAGNRQALSVLLHAGVTTVLPALATAPLDDLVQALEAVVEVQNGQHLPRVPGAHLEGPFFSPAQRGAQDPASLLLPTDDRAVDRLLEFSDAIAMLSLAPELSGAVTLTERLVDHGIVAAAGHTDGRDEDLWACQRAGLSHVIHVFSGQSTTIRRGPWRYPGMLEATLSSEGLSVEMIGDGKHLPATLMKLAHRCLAGRLCLVSDATPGAGMPEGSRYRMGEVEYLVEGGVGVTEDRSAFGGSTTLVSEMVPITKAALGIGVADVLAMVTSIPADAARLSGVGRIVAGHHADFALFDEHLKLQRVALAGRWL